MGYTHYWYHTPQPKPAHDKQWNSMLRLANDLFNHHPLAGADGTGGAEATPEHIVFNGVGDDKRHETFWFSRDPDQDLAQRRKERTGEDRSFRFCKTARKPYDLCVVAMLARAERLDLIRIESDGSPAELKDGRKLEQQLGQ
jgi:hypothetical protein